MKTFPLSLSYKLLLAILAILLPIGIIFLNGYKRIEKGLRDSTAKELNMLAEAFEDRLYQSIDMHKRRAIDFTSDGIIKEGVKQLSKNEKSALTHIVNHLKKNKLPLDKSINNISLISSDGRVIASTHASMTGKDVSNRPFFIKGKQWPSIAETETDLSGLYELAVSAPISDASSGKITGVLVNFIKFTELNDTITGGLHKKHYPLVQHKTAKKQTLETYLVNKDMLMLTDSIFVKDAILRQKVDTLPVRECLNSNNEIYDFYRDYRGVMVAGASMCLPDLKWTLIVEIDEAEALGQLKKLKADAALAIIAILCITLIIFLVFYKETIGHIKKLAATAKEIANGNYNISIPVQTRDEVGDLTELFNIMTRNIKKQTDMLVESEERLRAIIDSSTAVIYLKDLEGRYIIVNKRFEELFHLTKEELTGKTDYDLFPEDIASAFRKNDVEVIKNRRPLQIEETALHADGQAHQYLSIKFPILDSKMAIYAVCGISTDITERKKVEEKITTLSYAVEQSPSIIMITDTKGSIEYVNPSFTQVTGYPSEEVIGKNAEEFGNQKPEEKEKMWDALTAIGEWRGAFLNKKKNGESYWELAAISAIRNQQGITIHFLKAAEDITKRKQIEDEIIKSRASLSNAQKIASLGDWEWDIVKNELRWSDEIYRIFSVEPQHFNATYDAFLDSVHPEDRGLVRMAVNNALLGKKPYSIDHRIILPDGTVRVVHEQSEVVFDKAGKAIMMTGTVQDITERKKLEEQFRHAQKMEAIGQLAGGIAHDFNNILTAVNGYANLLLVKKGDAILVKSYTDHILNLSEKAAKLVRDLLSFSRRQPVFIRPTDLNELIREVETIMLHLIGENIEFTANLSDEGITVQIDPPQIEQVLMNLATNARDAMPSGGKLTISTQPAGVDNEFIKRYGAGKAGQYTLQTSADNGMGMDEATQKKIFEPFFTTKEVGKGTGLGLSMVYGIIKQHGGFINLRSKPASGTTFYIYLPMTEHAEIDAKRHTEEVFIPKRETGVVLLAEDETAVRDVTKLILEEHGYTVIEAADGDDAINKYMENKDKIQLLILDVMMPKKSGKAVYEEISKMSPDIKVIFLSGYARNVINVEEIIGHGWSILSKPVSSDELLNKISEVLNK